MRVGSIHDDMMMLPFVDGIRLSSTGQSTGAPSVLPNVSIMITTTAFNDGDQCLVPGIVERRLSVLPGTATAAANVFILEDAWGERCFQDPGICMIDQTPFFCSGWLLC
mmetsp:Transcript_1439/g.4178  ORF Transcript_1439/g.4178 Transcript_1439/m.4178 type:complete len:109 (+) Transcript_1439:436-762(+)